MSDQQILLDYFLLRPRGLRIYRVEQPNTATLLWTSRNALMDYLHGLRTTHALKENTGQRSSGCDRHQGR